MNIDVKKSTKPVNYKDAIDYLENRLIEINNGKSNELIWLLEHPSIFTAGTSYRSSDVIDKSINLIKTSRGGKITWHGPGQLICYFLIDLNKRGKDIRKFINLIENFVSDSLNVAEHSEIFLLRTTILRISSMICANRFSLQKRKWNLRSAWSVLRGS